MKKSIIAALVLALLSGSAFAGGEREHGRKSSGNQAQGQAQGQAQLQGQVQGQAQFTNVSNRISNDSRANAKAFSTSGATSGATAASGGNILTVNEAPIPANTTQTIHQDSYTVRGVPNVLSGNIYPTAPCMGSSAVGGSGVGFGFSVGTSWKDDECGVRETARSFQGMNLPADALAVLCTSAYAAAAPSCKALEAK
jgi:hypothetical protein